MPVLVVYLFAAVALSAADDARLQLIEQLKRATELQAQNKFVAAAEVYTATLEKIDATSAPELQAIAPAAHSGLASVYQDLGQFDQAEKSYLRALRLYAEMKEDRHKLAIHTLVNLGSLYWETQQYGRLRETCKSALDLLEGLEEVGAESARLHQLLSMFAGAEGRQDEARQRLKHAIAIWRTLPGDQGVRVGDALNSLGALAFRTGQYPEALALFQESLSHFRNRGESANRNLAGALANLACTYLHLKRREQADAAYDEAVSLLERTVGPQHPYTAHTILSYAVVLERMGMKKQSRAERKRAEAILAAAEPLPSQVVDVVELQGHE